MDVDEVGVLFNTLFVVQLTLLNALLPITVIFISCPAIDTNGPSVSCQFPRDILCVRCG